MTRKPTASSDTFTSHEIFQYLVTELELVVASGTIKWTLASAIAARNRLDALVAALHQVGTRLGNGE